MKLRLRTGPNTEGGEIGRCAVLHTRQLRSAAKIVILL